MVTNINKRHTILSQTIGTRPEENHSYEQAQLLHPATICFFLLGTVLEIVFYLVFNFKLHPWKEMMMEDDDSNPEKQDRNTSETIHSLMIEANLSNNEKSLSRHGINMTKSDTPQDNDKAPLSIAETELEEEGRTDSQK